MGSKKIYRKYAMLIVLLILLIGLSGIMLSRDRKENSQSKGEEAEATTRYLRVNSGKRDTIFRWIPKRRKMQKKSAVRQWS